MENVTIKGAVLINPARGSVKVVSRHGRLSFPVDVIESGTSARTKVRNYFELIRLIRRVKIIPRRKNTSRSMLIRARINTLLSNHQDTSN